MAEAKAKPKSGGGDEVADAGAQEVQDKFDEATEKGYHGTVSDSIDNKEYSVVSGPDSPTIAEIDEALANNPDLLKKGQVK